MPQYSPPPHSILASSSSEDPPSSQPVNTLPMPQTGEDVTIEDLLRASSRHMKRAKDAFRAAHG